MKIALIGSHGVGKTTLCFEVAAAHVAAHLLYGIGVGATLAIV